MSRAERLFELVHLLSHHRARTLAELVEHFGVSERTMYRDLASLEKTVALRRDEYGYRLVEGAAMPAVVLTTVERAVLALALRNPTIERLPALATPLGDLRRKLGASAAANGPASPALSGPDRSGAVTKEVLDVIDAAIADEREVEIQYISLSDGKAKWRGVDPWRIFHRGDAWYLVGRCHVHDGPRMFRLDRIEGARAGTKRFARTKGFDLDAHLEHAWTIFRSEELWDVRVRFAKAVAPLIEHARHHDGEEKSPRRDGSIDYRVRVSHLDEIARWLVGFGANATVLGPDELRTKIVDLADGAKRANALTQSGRGKK